MIISMIKLEKLAINQQTRIVSAAAALLLVADPGYEALSIGFYFNF